MRDGRGGRSRAGRDWGLLEHMAVIVNTISRGGTTSSIDSACRASAVILDSEFVDKAMHNRRSEERN